MGFLIRTAFWLGLVLLIIPFGGVGGNGDRKQNLVSPIEAFQAAREAAGDIAGMCGRRPEVCAVGRSAMTTIGVHAREGAKIAYELLDKQFGSTDKIANNEMAKNDTGKPDLTIETGTIARKN